jgi:hypothetical protein
MLAVIGIHLMSLIRLMVTDFIRKPRIRQQVF